ncbi:MAG: hypothetical protein HC897_00745 [Thermoanaerobaculia bacterium]|nr:hypothetical protein [Thermoanaerobaculia bacterium]
MRTFHLAWAIPFTVLSWLFFPAVGQSGTWLVDNPAISIFIDEDDIIHPYLYVGNGGVRTVRVCIDPTSPLSAEMSPSIQAAIQTFNSLQPSTSNYVASSSEVPLAANDFLSVVLHELLHCIAGIGHVNVSPDVATGLPGLSTNSFAGNDGVFNLGHGADARYGTSDDPRGDDVNFFWFDRNTNNPFILQPIIDETTYSRELPELPPGHLFAADGNFISADGAGFPDIKPVMERVGFAGTENRLLAPDDTVNLRYGMSGIDEAAGTSDDYSIIAEFGGVSTTGCHVSIRFSSNEPDDFFAGCTAQAIAIQAGSTHFRLAGTGTIKFNIDKPWHFFGVSVFSDGFETGDFAAWSVAVP